MEPAAVERVDWFAPLAIAGLGVLGLYVVSLFGARYTPW